MSAVNTILASARSEFSRLQTPESFICNDIVAYTALKLLGKDSDLQNLGSFARTCKKIFVICHSDKLIHAVEKLDRKIILFWQKRFERFENQKYTDSQIINLCPTLQELDLSNDGEVDDDFIKRLTCQNLKFLNLKNCQKLVSPNFNIFPNLMNLELSGCASITYLNIDSLNEVNVTTKNCPQLIYDDPNISSMPVGTLQAISTKKSTPHHQGMMLDELTELNLDKIENYLKILGIVPNSDSALKLINRCKNLTHLDLEDAKFVDDDFVKNLHCSKLETINLSKCDGLSCPDFTHLKALKFIDARFCLHLRDFTTAGKVQFDTAQSPGFRWSDEYTVYTMWMK